MESPYDSWADYYDLTDADRKPFISFYSSLLTPSTRAVLELGCGTGTILRALEQCLPRESHSYGVRAIGLDQSLRMLQRAREKAPHLHWIRADLGAPPLKGRFDLIASCFNTLQHVTSFDGLVAALSASRRLLADDGMLAFDVYNPNADYLRTPKRNRMARAVTSVQGHRLEIIENTDYDPVAEVLTIDWQLQDCTTPERTPLARTRYLMRQYWPHQIEEALALAGLRPSERYGDFNRQPFTPASKRQVVICRAM